MVGLPNNKTFVESSLGIFGSIAVAVGLLFILGGILGSFNRAALTSSGHNIAALFLAGFSVAVTGLLIMGTGQALRTFRLMAHNTNNSGD